MERVAYEYAFMFQLIFLKKIAGSQELQLAILSHFRYESWSCKSNEAAIYLAFAAGILS